MNTALEYSTRVVQEGDRRCKKSTLNDLAYLTPLRIPLMNPVYSRTTVFILTPLIFRYHLPLISSEIAVKINCFKSLLTIKLQQQSYIRWRFKFLSWMVWKLDSSWVVTHFALLDIFRNNKEFETFCFVRHVLTLLILGSEITDTLWIIVKYTISIKGSI